MACLLVHVCLHVSVYACAYVDVCVYIYIYTENRNTYLSIHTHIYIYMYVYMCIHIHTLSEIAHEVLQMKIECIHINTDQAHTEIH